MTPRDIVTLALKKAGVLATGQTANSEMANGALMELNAMIGQWAVKRWIVYHLINITLPCTGATSYTIGPGGDFNIAVRPSKIDSAFVSQNNGLANQIDTPLTIIEAREDFNRIAMKSLVSFPYLLFYDNAFPLGVVHPWPAPNGSLYGLTVTVKMPLSAFSDLSQDINLPAEYQEALFYNLAARLRVTYQLDLDPAIIGLAKAALATVRTANVQVPLLQMPSGMRGGSRYNVYSDQGR